MTDQAAEVASTRERICAAAFDLFGEKGYDGASMNELAERVGIAKPSIYNYFKSKEEVFRALGVDTLSIDPGVSEEFETHLILLGADRYGLENLANLDRLPRRGSTIVVGLIPYEQGSGGQARIFASW